jgi:hypothetical protein
MGNLTMNYKEFIFTQHLKIDFSSFNNHSLSLVFDFQAVRANNNLEFNSFIKVIILE